MLRVALSLSVLALLVPAWCAETESTGSLIPPGIRAIPTLDDCAIILVSDPTNGAGTGLDWLGVGGAIACEADNSIIVWSTEYAPPLSALPPAAPTIAPPPSSAQPDEPSQGFLWPEGIEDAVSHGLERRVVFPPEAE